jgi:cellulose synthase operon protein C
MTVSMISPSYLTNPSSTRRTPWCARLEGKLASVTSSRDPNNGVASNNLVYLMMQTGDNVDVALSLAQTARRILPNSPQTADTLARIYYFKGNYVSARDLLEGALKQMPDDASMHFHLGMTYAKLNDKSDAQIHLKKAATLAPNTKTGLDANDELDRLG